MIKLRTLTKPTSGRVGRSSGNSRFLLSTGLAVLAAVGVADIARSQTWTGAVDTDFGTAGNWDNLAVPGPADDVIIDNGVATVVDANPPGGTINSLRLGEGTLNINANTAAVVTTNVSIETTAALNVRGTSSVTADTFQAGASSVVTVQPNGSLIAQTSYTGSGAATLNVNGLLDGNVTLNQDASVSVGGGGVLDGNLNMAGSTPNAQIATGGQITGNVGMSNGSLTSDGSIGGTLTSTGPAGANTITITSNGSVGGLTSVSGANVTSAGALNGGLTVGTASDVTIQSGGTIAGAVAVNGGADLTLQNGSTVTGTVTLNGNASPGGVSAAGTINGSVVVNGGIFTNTGTINNGVATAVTVNAGTMNAQGTITGDISVAGGNFNVTGVTTHTGNVTNNAGITVSSGSLNTSGTVLNNGGISVANGANFGFTTMTNNGQILLGAGTAGSIAGTLTGTVTNVAGSQFDLVNGVAGDTITITGDLNGPIRLNTDVDLRTSFAGGVDSLTVGGALNGALTVDGSEILANINQFTLQNPMTVVNAGSLGAGYSNLTNNNLTLTGLPQTGSLVIYGLLANGSNIELRSELNPALGGVAGAVASVSSLIGTVINRPSGAYVSGIAFDAPGNCSTGTWVRASGGRIAADTTTTNTTTGGFTQFTVPGGVASSGITDFRGLQGGIDFGCFEAFNGGWDVSGGLLLGHNTGWFSQFSFGSLTRGGFDQSFVGAYVAASTGNWSGEIQLRRETGDLNFFNAGLSLFNSEIDSEGYTLSGSVTYRYALENSWSLLPTAGFAISRSEVSALNFATAAGAPMGTLQVEDHTNKTSFIGATLGRTLVDLSASAASNHFVTATYYMDHGGSRTSTFTSPAGPAAGQATLSTGEIGNFGEISVGTAYVKVLNSNPGSVRQFNASVRTDFRFGGEVDGTSLTGQMRLQF